MNDSINNNNQISEGGLNFKTILGKFLAFLPYFIISLVLSLSIAFLVVRYSTPTYLVKTTLLIKEKGGARGGMDGAESFLQGMQLLSTSRNIENEQGILKSRSLVEETLKQLDFGISYYGMGQIKKTEFYGDGPFLIELDSNHIQLIGTEIELFFSGNNSVEVLVENSSETFVPKTSEILGKVGAYPKKKFNISEPIIAENFSFRIIVLDPRILEKEGRFSFKLNTFNSLVKAYADKYQVKAINKQASIVEISKIGNYPNKEIAFLNQLCNTYIEMGMDDKSKVTQKTVRFIDEQLNAIIDSLGQVEDQMRNFRSANKIVSLSETGRVIADNLNDLEKGLAQEKLKEKYYSYLEAYLIKNLKLNEIVAPSSMGINEPLLNSLLQKLVETYSRKKTLELSYGPTNPMILEVNQLLESLKLTTIENLKNIRKSSEIVVKDFNERISSFSSEIGALPASEQKLLNMTRRYTLSDKLYTYLLEKRAEAGIAGAGINPEAKVIDKAILVNRVYPQTGSIYSMALAIGLMLPLIIILILEFFNNDIKNHSQLQVLTKLPLLGNIVHNSKNTALVIANHPKSQISEAFRNLRSNLNYLATDKKSKIIMTTSTVSGEGKTFISMNLASVLAIGGYKTILIGVDLRKPKIFQDFKLDNSFGLTNYLIGKLDKNQIIQHSGVSNLDIITSGPTPPNPAELIMSEAFYRLIEEYKEEYDYIILDTPPIGLVADGLDVMKHVDIVLYVVRQNISKKNYLGLINELFQNDKDRSFGLIFNDVNFAAIYGYGYGSYGYGYGSSYGSSYGYGYSGGYGYGYGYGGYGDTEVEKKGLWKRMLGK
jgi:tyrosine-protein kinase Etk/Wzc